jgi:hypothetical protein
MFMFNRKLFVAFIPMTGFGIFATAIILLHYFQPDLFPLNGAMSYYVHGSQGSLLIVGLLALGIGSLSLTLVLKNLLGGRRGQIGYLLLLIWSIGVMTGAIFPADPPGNWDKPPTLSGMIHGNVALLAFLAFPFGALLISKTLGDFKKNSRVNALFIFALLSLISLFLFFASVIPAIVSPGPPKLLGLTERVLFICYISWLSILIVKVLRDDRLH